MIPVDLSERDRAIVEGVRAMWPYIDTAERTQWIERVRSLFGDDVIATVECLTPTPELPVFAYTRKVHRAVGERPYCNGPMYPRPLLTRSPSRVTCGICRLNATERRVAYQEMALARGRFALARYLNQPEDPSPQP